jgi:uncharacterized protein (DUF58 family)
MRYRYHVNMGGVFYLVVTVLVGLAATIRPNNLLVWVFGLLLGLIVLSGLISGVMLMRVRITRLDPVHGRVDQPLAVRYSVENLGRLIPLFDLRITERRGQGLLRFTDVADAWVMHSGPGELVHAEAVLVPRRRGRLRFTGIEGFSSFPLGFIGKSVRIRQPMDTLIFPRTVMLRREVIESLLGKHGVGARPGRRSGQGGEYFGLREYRSGDSLRSVAWKRVRPDEGLIVMQRSITAPPRALFVLDLRRPTDELRVEEEGEFDPRELEERAISLIGSLAETAMSLGVEFGLRVPGIDLVPLPVRGGRRHMDRLLAHLAAIDLDRPRIESSTRIPVRNQETMVVVHPDRVDPSIGGDGAWHLLPSSLEEFAVNPTGVSAATESEVAA